MKKIIFLLSFWFADLVSFSQSTDAALKTQADVIRNETVANANSKTRVANMFQALTDSKVNRAETLVASGTNTYTVMANSTITSYANKIQLLVQFTNGNTGSATLNVNSLGAKTIKKSVSADLSSGDIAAGQILLLVYDGTNFQIAGSVTSGNLVAGNNLSDLTSTATARTNLGLGTLATQSGTFSGTSSGTNTGDQTISDATISTTDVTTNNVSTSKHGFAPKLPNDATKYLNGTGAFTVPAGSGSGWATTGTTALTGAATIDNSTYDITFGTGKFNFNTGAKQFAIDSKATPTTFPVMTLKPSVANTNNYFALDIMPSGPTPPTTNSSGGAIAWIDVCNADLINNPGATSNYMRIGMDATGGVLGTYNLSGGANKPVSIYMGGTKYFGLETTGRISAPFYTGLDDQLSGALSNTKYVFVGSGSGIFYQVPADKLKVTDPLTSTDANLVDVLAGRTTLVRNRVTTDYTLALTDRSKLVEMNSSSAHVITVPLNSSVAFVADQTTITLVRYGTGTVTITPAGGVTIHSAGGMLTLRAQYSSAQLIKIGTDEWYLIGDLL